MADAIIQQGHLTQAEFDANPTLVLDSGQIVWLKDNSGNFKKGDGVTALSALPFLGSQNLAQTLANGNEFTENTIVGTNTVGSVLVAQNANGNSSVSIDTYPNGGRVSLNGASNTETVQIDGETGTISLNGNQVTTTSDLPTLTSQLTNDGSDTVNPFITSLDLPTVDTTIIDGSTNAVSGNAVFDGLTLKQSAIGYVTVDTSLQTNFYSDIFLAPLTENHTITADILRGNPFVVRKQSTLDALSIRISSGATAGTNGRLAIYTNVNQNKLGVKLWEGSNFSTVTASTIVVTGIGLSLAPGMYWAVFNSSASSGLLRTSTGATKNDILGSLTGTASPISLNGITYSPVSFGSAFPADLTATAPTGYTTGTNCPAIFQGYL